MIRASDIPDVPVKLVTRDGREFRMKPGRPKRLSAVDAAVIFDAQVQMRAAKLLIDRILGANRVNTKQARERILRLNWQDRGRIDIPHEAFYTRAKRALWGSEAH